MHILIAGGTGFIGSALCAHFLKAAHRVTVLTRDPQKKYLLPDAVKLIADIKADEPYDVIINLVGEPLYKKRWNEDFKKILRDSRLLTTEKIINYIKSASVKPKLFISGSGVGFYGNSAETIFTENSLPENSNFLQELCRDWEATAIKATEYGVRVCISRTGVVIGKNGGILQQILMPARLGISATIGNGQQWISWIEMDDLVRAFDFLIHHPELNGAFNLSTPNPVTNKTLTKTLAKTLHRPSFLKFPAPIVKILFGQMGEEVLLGSQKVLPEKLIKSGFIFQHPDLEPALKEVLG